METTVTLADGTEREVNWIKIGGRNEVGSFNWGPSDDYDRETAEAIANEIESHVGGVVLLTGGGGHGYDVARLNGISVGNPPSNDCEAKPRADLTILYGRRFGSLGPEFTPWIDSWQLSVPETDEGREHMEAFASNIEEQMD